MLQNKLPLGREDMLLLFFALGAAIVALSMGGQTEELSPQCKQWASETEANLSSQYSDTSCECVPGEQYQARLDTPDPVKEQANLHVIKCDIDGQEIAFPIWQVNNTKVLGNQTAGVVNGTN